MQIELVARIVNRVRTVWATGDHIAAIHLGMNETAEAHGEAVFLAYSAAIASATRANRLKLRTKLCHDGSLDVGRWVRGELLENLHDELFSH